MYSLSAENTSLNNNNNNSLNANHTISYADKFTQTTLTTDDSSDSLKIAETQTDAANDNHDAICCLNSIPYVDQSITPPVIHRALVNENSNCNGGDNHVNARNSMVVDESAEGANVISTTAIVNNTTQHDNGDVPHRENCENSVEVL